MGNYVELTGLRCCVSSWRRTPDTAIPARGKLTGSYINTALAVDEAQRAGYDDAIFLTQDGHVSEASAANIFLLRKGGLVTPPVTADILEGITRDAVLELTEREQKSTRLNSSHANISYAVFCLKKKNKHKL